MNGVRFVSIVFATVAAFLWGGFVVHSWQKNLTNRSIVAELQASQKVQDLKGSATLQHADEMALAASEVFNKHLDDIQTSDLVSEKNKKGSRSKKSPWVVADAVAPSYDEAAVVEITAGTWRVPDGVDPIYVNPVGAKIAKIADKVTLKVSDTALHAKDKVGSAISKLASKVKEKIVGTEEWKVPSAKVPDVVDVSRLEDMDVWQVPSGATPSYNQKSARLVVLRGDVVDENVSKTELKISSFDRGLRDRQPVTEGGVPVEKLIDSGATKTQAQLSDGSYSKTPVKIDGKTEARLGDPSFEVVDIAGVKKDTARLSKDGVMVPFDKYAWRVPVGNTPDYDETIVVAAISEKADAKKSVIEKPELKKAKVLKKVAANKTPLWIVPTGKTPEYKIAKEVIVAAVVSPEGPDVKATNFKSASPKKLLGKGIVTATIDTEEPELFVSATMQDAEYPVQSVEETNSSSPAAKNTPKKPGVVSRIKKSISKISKFFSKDKIADADEPVTFKKTASRVEQVRFEAIKSLMVDEVDYKFTDIKKGEGKLSVSGRSQPDVMLSVYIDLTYLGDVRTSSAGEWNVSKELYLAKGGHMIRAEQMSDSGIVLVRKTQVFKQSKSVKPPKGYKEETIGNGVGDKALAELRNKLNKDGPGQKPKSKSFDIAKLTSDKMADDGDEEVDVVVAPPLPVKKSAEQADAKAKDKLIAAAKVVADKKAVILEAKRVAAAKVKAEKKAALEAKRVAAAKVKAEKKAALEVKRVAAAKVKAEKKAALEVKRVAAAKVKAEKKAALEVKRVAAAKVKAEKKAAALEAKLVAVAAKKKVALEAKRIAVAEKKTALEAKRVADAKVKAEKKVATLEAKRVAAVEAKKKESGEIVIAALEKDAPKDDDVKTAKKAVMLLTPKNDIYVVRKGDTLGVISQRVYGTSKAYKKILELNPSLKNPNRIYPSQKLRVGGVAEIVVAKPVKVAALKKDVAVKVTKAKVEKSASKDDAKKTPNKAMKAVAADGYYVVRRGDNLWKIAQRVFGNGARFKEIIKLNPNIAKNPRLIQPKLKLRVKAA